MQKILLTIVGLLSLINLECSPKIGLFTPLRQICRQTEPNQSKFEQASFFGAIATALGFGLSKEKQEQLNAELIQAFEAQNLEAMKELLDKGADVNLEYHKGMQEIPDHNSLLLHAITYEYPEEIVIELIKRKANVKVINGFGETPLIKAIQRGHTVKIVKAIIKSLPNKSAVNYCINRQARFGETALLEAIMHNFKQLEIVKELIKNGANVNLAKSNNDTPIMLAVWRAHGEESISIIEEILKHKPNLNAEDKQGKTALNIATFLNKQRVIDMLIAAGATE